MKFDGTSWVHVGIAGFSAGQSHWISLVISPSGQPYVAYTYATGEWMFMVMKFDGINWLNIGNFEHAASSGVKSLAFNPADGQLYVAYKDFYAPTYLGKATVAKYDGTNWVNVGNAWFSQGNAEFESVAFSPSGEPYVAYQDWGNSHKATVMKFDGNNWVDVGNAGFSSAEADYTSLAFSSSGQPFVAFTDLANSQKATVMHYDISTGIFEPLHSALSFFPNPAHDNITVETPGTKNESYLIIADVEGRELIRQTITGIMTRVDISELPGGIYFVRQTNNKTIEFGKLIKQ
jgi:hypothetical protein